MFFTLNWQYFFDRHYQLGLAYSLFKKYLKVITCWKSKYVFEVLKRDYLNFLFHKLS